MADIDDSFKDGDKGPEIRRKLNLWLATFEDAIANARGPRGWAPVPGLEEHDDKTVLKVVDWTGGEGEKPAIAGYIGADGITPYLAEAISVRGRDGQDGDITPELEALRDAVKAYRDQAEGFSNSASSSAAEAYTYRGQALGYADAASTSASNAEDSEVAAGQHKAAAQDFASQAEDAATSSAQARDASIAASEDSAASAQATYEDRVATGQDREAVAADKLAIEGIQSDVNTSKGQVNSAAAQVAQDKLDVEAAKSIVLEHGNGWSPVFAGEYDNDRAVLKIIDWYGGVGTKPPTGYVGTSGLVATPAEALNVRGLPGAGGLADAPVDGKQYARKDGTWVEFVSGATSWNDLADMPAFVAAGSTALEARSTIGATQIYRHQTADTLDFQATPTPTGLVLQLSETGDPVYVVDPRLGTVTATGVDMAAARAAIAVLSKTETLDSTEYFRCVESVPSAVFLNAVTIGNAIPSSPSSVVYAAGQLRACLGGGAHVGKIAQLQSDGTWTVIADNVGDFNRVVSWPAGGNLTIFKGRSGATSSTVLSTFATSYVSDGTTNVSLLDRLNQIGTIANLSTTAKSSVVLAVNELVTKLGGTTGITTIGRTVVESATNSQLLSAITPALATASAATYNDEGAYFYGSNTAGGTKKFFVSDLSTYIVGQLGNRFLPTGGSPTKYASADSGGIPVWTDTATGVGAAIAAVATKATPVDADSLWVTDSAASNVPKRITWNIVKAAPLAANNSWTGSNSFTNSPTVPSPASNDNTQKAAPTAWVNSAIAAAAGGGLKLLSVTAVSAAVAYLDVTGLGNGYDKYEIHFEGLVPSENYQFLCLRASADSSGDVDTTTVYNFVLAARSSFTDNAYVDRETGGNRVRINGSTFDIPNTLQDGGVSGVVRLHRPWNTQVESKTMDYEGTWAGSADQAYPIAMVRGSATYRNYNAITRIRLYFQAGNIKAGTVRLYGLQKAL